MRPTTGHSRVSVVAIRRNTLVRPGAVHKPTISGCISLRCSEVVSGREASEKIEKTTAMIPMDYELRRCSRQCALTGRELREGETFYSVLTIEDGQLVRHDYSSEAWQGVPVEGVVAWWRSQIPTSESKRRHMAPNDVLLDVFQELENQPDQTDVRYVLALLLIRRRVLRLEDSHRDGATETLDLYCPRLEQHVQVKVETPTPDRIEEIETWLEGLLFARAD